jgi:hypothetical protein
MIADALMDDRCFGDYRPLREFKQFVISSASTPSAWLPRLKMMLRRLHLLQDSPKRLYELSAPSREPHHPHPTLLYRIQTVMTIFRLTL